MIRTPAFSDCGTMETHEEAKWLILLKRCCGTLEWRGMLPSTAVGGCTIKVIWAFTKSGELHKGTKVHYKAYLLQAHELSFIRQSNSHPTDYYASSEISLHNPTSPMPREGHSSVVRTAKRQMPCILINIPPEPIQNIHSHKRARRKQKLTAASYGSNSQRL